MPGDTITSANARPGATCRITLNGDPREVSAGTTLAALLEAEGLAGRRVAVEVNREIVPRGAHATHEVREGDQVEVVHALGGG